MGEDPNPDWSQKLHDRLIAAASKRALQNTEQSSSPRRAILDGLVDIYGKPIGRFIDSNLVSNPAIRKFVVMGQPAAGKTIILSQVDDSIYSLAQEMHIPIERAIILYDNSLKNAKRLGETTDTAEFNQALVQRVSNPIRYTTIYAEEGVAKKRVVLAEIPAVGQTKPKDRGVSAFEELAKNSQDTLFLYIVAHPMSQLSGLTARFTALILPANRVVRALRELHNIIIEAPEIEDEEVLGRIIKNSIRWNAKGVHVRTILYEMADQFFQWRYLERKSFEKSTEEIILPESYNPDRVIEQLTTENTMFLDPEDRNYHEELRGKARLRASLLRMEAAYAQHRFRELGIPEDRGIVAFSPYQPNPIHLYINR